MKTTRALAAGLLAIGSLLGAVAVAPAAQAHAELVMSDPMDGAVLDARPARVTFTFNEPLMPDFVRFIGTDPAGATGDLPVSFVEGTSAGIDWPDAAPAGEWQVSYRVVSQDGHTVEGGITFSYAAPSPSPTASPTASPTPSPTSPTSDPTSMAPSELTPSPSVSPAADTGAPPTGWLIAGGALAVIAVVGVVLALVMRRPQ